MINDTQLRDILDLLSENGYYFNEISVANCEDLINANGFTFSSFELHRGINYRIYCIREDGMSSVYCKIAENTETFNHFVDAFKGLSKCIENETNQLHIYLHQIPETISLKDFLVHNFDDNFKLQSVYEHFVSFYNVITKHNISIFEPKAERIALNADGEIKIKNLDYFICAECSENTSVKNDTPLFLNSIWLLTFLRIVTDNPDLLVDDNIFLEMEKGISEEFLQEHMFPSLSNKDYRLLLSIITFIQHKSKVEIEIDKTTTCDTKVTKDDLESSKIMGGGRLSQDGKRFYCIYKMPTYRFSRIEENNTLNISGCEIVCDRALSDVRESSDIHLSEGINTLGRDLFYGVNRVKRIDLPESLKAICGNPFEKVIIEEINNLSPHFVATSNALYSKGFHRLISYYGNAKEFKVPNKTAIIGEDAFSCNKSIVEVTFEESVIEIGDKAFTCCSNLKKISLPNSLKRIGRQAFQQSSDTKLKELRIPKNVEFIGRVAFDGISKIECEDSPFFKIEDHSLLSKNGEDLLYYFGDDKTYRIPNGVKTVWAAAFWNNNSIKEIIVPHSVKVIEDSAFSECKQLSSVIFECDYLSLGEMAFFCCENLRSIKMPKEMGNINHSTFYGCKELSEIDIPEGVEIIGESAFSGCSSLKKIKLPYSIKTIDESAFNDCKNLDDVVLPEGLKIIGTQAFEYCSALSKITFPRSLEVVKNRAFSGCSLKECIVKSEMTIIYYDAFKPFGNDEMLLYIPPKSDPHKYTSIIPEGIRGQYETTDGPLPVSGPKTENIIPSIDDKSIDELLSTRNDGSLLYFEDKNGCVYADGLQRLIEFNNERIRNSRNYIVSSRAKYICNNAFGNRLFWSKNTPFQEIELSQCLRAIGDYSFVNCNIKVIKLPNSLEYIGDFAFMNCLFLSHIVIPEKVSHIGINPFYKCNVSEIVSNSPHYIIETNCLINSDTASVISCCQKEMIEFSIPDGINCICDYSFAGVGAESINISSSVETIDEGAFENGLFSSISIPSQVAFIGNKAFSKCKNLLRIDLSSTKIEAINDELFNGCVSLKEVTLPKNATLVGNYAFRGCKELVSISLPQNLEKIGANPFIESGIIDIVINNNNYKLIDGILYGSEGKEIIAVLKSASKSIVVPNGVEVIRQEAFASNTNVEEIKCPESLKVIEIKAFAGCSSLRKIHLEVSSVRDLAESVFDGCAQLEFISLPKHLCEIGDEAFHRCEKLETLTLPSSVRIIKGKAFERSGLKCINLSYGLKKEILPWEFRCRAKLLSLEECNLYKDEFGVVFSDDRKVLIEASGELESYIVPIGTEIIKSCAFMNARNLKRISIPDTVKNIGAAVFGSDLDELILPDSVIEIGDKMFWHSQSMKEFIIPQSVKTIHGNPFGMMFNSKAGKPCKIINKSELFTLINGLLYSKDLKSLICCTDYSKNVIDILDSVEYINYNALDGCQAEYIVIPPSVRKIESYAFSRINVTELSIPQSVELIEREAFWGSQNLQTIRFYNPQILIEHGAFDYCKNIMKVVVPKGSLDWFRGILPAFYNQIEEMFED